MRSQVQVLAGPPPIVAGHSAPSTEPGALAAGLGRAGAAHPLPAVTSSGPPGPPTRPSGSATTTRRGRVPSRGRQAGGGVPPPRAAACPSCPPPSRRRRALRTPAWPAGSRRGQARPPRPAPTRRPGSATDPPDQPDFGSVARIPASWTVDRAVNGPAATGASTRSGGHGRPATATRSPPPPPEYGRRRTRPDGRSRHQTAGHRTGGQQTADRRILWTTTPGDRTPDGWTAGSRTPNPDGGHRMLDTPATDAVACLLAGSTTATTPDLSIPAGRSSGQTSSGRAPTRTA
jgi:hypothetical protein